MINFLKIIRNIFNLKKFKIKIYFNSNSKAEKLFECYLKKEKKKKKINFNLKKYFLKLIEKVTEYEEFVFFYYILFFYREMKYSLNISPFVYFMRLFKNSYS